MYNPHVVKVSLSVSSRCLDSYPLIVHIGEACTTLNAGGEI